MRGCFCPTKKYFDGLDLTKLPTVASLRAEYTEVLEEKKQTYRRYYL
jgi:hypothetical protein